VGTLISFEARKGLRRGRRKAAAARPAPSALEWLERGCDAEAEDDTVGAICAYTQALALDPRLAEAHVNLGHRLHELGRLGPAEGHYRLAILSTADHPTAWFNLGVVLEDQDRLAEAAAAYGRALAIDARCADAHHNLGGLLDALGDEHGAVRHLSAYRRLTRRRRAG
jgi:tetratricopeptide (TPR) repeat protein